MILILMRHGQSEADLLNVHEGRANFDLTSLGIKQVQETAYRLKKDYDIEKIYASPLLRAVHTTEIVASIIECQNIEYNDLLMEFNNGLLAGVNREEAKKKYPINSNLSYDESMYEMESLKEFRLRADKILKRIVENDESDVVMIIAHGGIINQLYQSFLEMPIPSYSKYITKDAGFHVWSIENNTRSILLTNQ